MNNKSHIGTTCAPLVLFIVMSIKLEAQTSTLQNRIDSTQQGLFIPFIIDSKSIANLIERATPSNALLKDQSKTTNYNLQFDLQDENSTFDGNKVSHSIKFYKGRGKYSTRIKSPIGNFYSPWINMNCKDIEGKIMINVEPYLSHDYELKTSSADVNLKISNARCGNLNVGSMMKALGLDKIKKDQTKNVNKILSNINLREPIEKICKKIQSPIHLENNNYLHLYIKSIQYQAFNFSAKNSSFGLLIDIESTINGNESQTVTSIPRLEQMEDNSTLGNKVGQTSLAIDYEDLDRMIKPYVEGKVISKKNKKGEKKEIVKIIKATITKSEDIEFDFKIDLDIEKIKTGNNGRISLWVSHHLDQENQMIYVSKIKSKTYALAFFDRKLLDLYINKIGQKKLKSSLELNSQDYTNKITEKINSMVERFEFGNNGIDIEGEVSRIDISKIELDKHGLKIDFDLDSDVHVLMNLN